MDRSRLIFGAVGTLAVAGAAAVVIQRTGPSRPERGEEQWTLVQTYCVECHSSAEASGGLVLEGMGPDSVPLEPQVFEAAVRKLRGRLMPPPGGPQPEQPRVDSFIAWLERTIDRSAVMPRAGHVPIQRLNRTEYAAAVHDLVGVDIDAAEFLPAEIEVDGFDNIAAALSVSPAFLEQYIGVARHVAHLAVGEPEPKVASVSFPAATDDQDDYVDGMPLGTRGGVRFTHNFLADGEYRITITDLDVGLVCALARERAHGRHAARPQRGVPRAARRPRGAHAREPRRRAGARRDHAAVREDSRAGRRPACTRSRSRSSSAPAPRPKTTSSVSSRTAASAIRARCACRASSAAVGVEGPFGTTSLSRTASRDKIFVCTPSIGRR